MTCSPISLKYTNGSCSKHNVSLVLQWRIILYIVVYRNIKKNIHTTWLNDECTTSKIVIHEVTRSVYIFEGIRRTWTFGIWLRLCHAKVMMRQGEHIFLSDESRKSRDRTSNSRTCATLNTKILTVFKSTQITKKL